jgi:hypothetical protein
MKYAPHSPNQGQDESDDNHSFAKEYPDQSPISPQPLYKEIWATYFDIRGAEYKQFKNCLPNSEEIQLCAIAKGVPVNHVDVEEIRHAHRNRNLATRRMHLEFTRRMQSFMCLNVFYIIVLVITINSSFSDYRNYKDECPNFSKASLGFSILNIASIVFSLIGIIAAAKKSEKLLKFYNGGIYLIMLITVLVTAYGLLKKDGGDECDGSPPKNISLIANGLFTVIILSLFSYSATKLKVSVIQINAETNNATLGINLANNNGNNVNNNNNQHAAAANILRV